MKKISKIKEIEKWIGCLDPACNCCPYCGNGKFNYIDKDTGASTPIECKCEGYFRNLLEAKEGIIQTQNRIREKVNFNDNKLSGDDKRYVIDSEKTLATINQTISDMANVASRRAYENGRGDNADVQST